MNLSLDGIWLRRHNFNYSVLTYGVGFYVENGDHFENKLKSQPHCKHVKKWKREEGWIQCEDCFKILEVNKSLEKEMRKPCIEKHYVSMRLPSKDTIKKSCKGIRKWRLEPPRLKPDINYRNLDSIHQSRINNIIIDGEIERFNEAQLLEESEANKKIFESKRPDLIPIDPNLEFPDELIDKLEKECNEVH